MGTEIERKFLVRGDGWKRAHKSEKMRQAYLCFGPPASIRVRVSDARALLNIKSRRNGIERDEYEYEIPLEEGQQLLDTLHVGSIIDKTRHFITHKGALWEVDVFHGANEGLIIAEIELDNVDQDVQLPDWAGEEVTSDDRYLNSHLARHPYSEWRDR